MGKSTKQDQDLSQLLQKVQRENELLRNALDSLPYGLSVQGPGEELLYSNESWRKYQELRSKALQEGRVHHDLDESLDDVFQGKTLERNVVITNGAKQEAHAETVLFEQFFPLVGKKHLALGLIEDITLKLRAEANVNESEAKHRNLVNNAPTIIYRCSTERGALFWSPKVETILGFSSRSLMQSPQLWNNSIQPKDAPAVQKAIDEAVPGKVQKIEYRIKTKAGKWIWLSDSFLLESKRGKEKIFLGYALDVTKEKNLEFELQDAERRMNLALRNSNTGVWDWNLETNQVYYSDVWKSMLGYAPHELENDFDNWRDNVHPEDFDRVYTEVNRLIKGSLDDNLFEVEFRMRHKQGHWVDILAKGDVLRHENGKAYRFTGTHQDLSERKKAQKEIEDARLRWQFALEGNDDGVWDWDLSTDEIYFSPQWKAMLGFTEDEISGSIEEWEKRVHPDDLETVYADIQDHLKGKTKIYSNIHRVLCKDGSYKYILDRGKVFGYDKEGKPLRMIGTHTDFTDQIRIQEELIASKEKFQTIYDIMHVGITITDDHGNIIDCNRESEKLFGITREEHLARNYSGKEWRLVDTNGETLTPENYASVRALKENKAILNQEMGLYKGDELTWLSVSAKPIHIDGYGVMIAYVDITELKESEGRLKAANKTKDRFFSIIAHDLRGPFNTLLNLSEMGLEDLHEERYEMLPEIMELMQAASKEAFELLNNLLDWSRVQVGTIQFHAKKVDFKDLAKRLINQLNPAAQKKQIKLQNNIKGSYVLELDPDMMMTILRNLLSNAIKFTPSGGEVTLGARKQGSNLRIYVKDTGVGMSPSKLGLLFSEQNVESTSGTNNEQGTGLGLALCKEFVDLHQGKIWAESTLNEGSTFYLEIPFND